MTRTPVVIGVDGTGGSLRALMWAAKDASLRGCSLRIVHTLPRYELDIPFFPPGRFEEAVTYARSIIREAFAMAQQAYPDLLITTELLRRNPAAALIGEAGDAQELVLGSKGDNIGNLLLGSTALQVVGHARCPVVVVGQASAGHDRIAVGTDGSADSSAALDYSFEQADLRGAELRVVSALGLPQGWPSHLLRPLPEDDGEVTGRRQLLEEQVAPLREEHPGVKTVLVVHRSDPLAALTIASHQADLLVLGARGRGGFPGLVLGSTAHHMLHYASCPMAVLRAAP